MQEAGVKQHDSASPPSVGLRAGAFAEVGTLILTNLRLIYVAKGSISRATAWALGGAIAARAVEKSVSQAEIDDLMRYEGSYFVPLQEITYVQAGRKLGGGYLSVLNCSPGKSPHTPMFLGVVFLSQRSGLTQSTRLWSKRVQVRQVIVHSSRAVTLSSLFSHSKPMYNRHLSNQYTKRRHVHFVGVR